MALGILLASLASAQATAQETPVPSPPPAPSPGPPPALEDLDRSILPRPLGDAELQTSEGLGSASTPSEDPRFGLHLGRVFVGPRFDARYVHAEGALLEDAQPVEDRYLELRPQVGAEVALSTGELNVTYGAHFRRGSSFDIVNTTVTHVGDASLGFELGGVTEVSAGLHHARGLLETAEVDPGREYFFQLGRYSRWLSTASLRFFPGGRADLTVAGSRDVVGVDEPAAFFDHVQNTVSATGGYELGPSVRANAGYSYSRIPFTAERPEAESQMHTVFAGIRGEVLPLTTGDLTFGYSTRTSPRAAAGGVRYSGVTAAARLEKSFTPSTSLTLAGGQATHESAFEGNAFYVARSISLALQAGLPASLSLQAAVGHHRNKYQTVAEQIGVPRSDVIRGFTVGLGRAVSRHAFVRVDYRWEKRESNLEAFDSRSDGLTLQIGLNAFDGAGP